MSQFDPNRPAEERAEAVMMPATEHPEAPHPAAQSETARADVLTDAASDGFTGILAADDPAMQPAQRPNASYTLERLRSEIRVPDGAQWFNASQRPISIGVASGANAPVESVQETMDTAQARRTVSQGAALQTLLRSATRQHTPAPVLLSQRPTVPVDGPPALGSASQPQMRGALRQVIRQTQMQQGTPVQVIRPQR